MGLAWGNMAALACPALSSSCTNALGSIPHWLNSCDALFFESLPAVNETQFQTGGWAGPRRVWAPASFGELSYTEHMLQRPLV